MTKLTRKQQTTKYLVDAQMSGENPADYLVGQLIDAMDSRSRIKAKLRTAGAAGELRALLWASDMFRRHWRATWTFSRTYMGYLNERMAALREMTEQA
jgi:hypothetical protein